MKVSAIPAQITTVEDRIAGNLNFTQLLLVSAPLFLTAVIFFLFPPIGRYSLYKIIIACLMLIVSGALSIRINDKIILDLVKLRLSFELRPRTYLYRKLQSPNSEADTFKAVLVKPKGVYLQPQAAELTKNARTRSRRLLSDSQYSVAFQTRRGDLSVKVDTK